ncbi:MAG: GNAT family N-acetyltransferase [Chloroflexi bacterium]|nr:GNAT family N-acetyltransferase [Chloroflexota bacterium]
MHIQLLSTLTIRSFEADDYAAITRLHSANFREFSMSPDQFRFEDSTRKPPCRLARWVAECEGRIVGFVHYEQNPHMYHPRKFQLAVVVDPAYHGRGIGRRLYDLVLAELQRFEPLTVDEWTRADMTWRIGFLERRGFVEDMRIWTSTLDVSRFEPSRFAAEVADVEAQGIQLRSWAELGVNDPQVQRRIYDNWLAVRADVPIPPNDQRTEAPFDEWLAITRRPDLLPAGYFVAIDGERFVGTSQLWKSPEPGELRTGLTGVRREYRRRGIALALKVRSLEFAQAQGALTVVTENEINNGSMISINDRLGFAKNPAWMHYVKTFGP